MSASHHIILKLDINDFNNFAFIQNSFLFILYLQGLKLHNQYCHNVYLGFFCRKLKLLSKGDHFWNLLWKLSKWILKHTKGSLLYLQQRFLLLLYPFIYEESYNSEQPFSIEICSPSGWQKFLGNNSGSSFRGSGAIHKFINLQYFDASNLKNRNISIHNISKIHKHPPIVNS